MTDLALVVPLGAGVVTMGAIYVGLFVDARRRGRASRSVSPPRPAGAPPPRRSDPAVDRAFTIAVVAASGMAVEQPPTDQLYRDFAQGVDEACERRRRMLAYPGEALWMISPT